MSNSTAINQVLSQMRAIQAKSHAIGVTPTQATEPTGGVKFSQQLASALDNVNESLQTSGKLQETFDKGDPSVSLAQVMIASKKAEVAFQATVQVRNKFVEAYKDIMNMPI